MSTKVLTGLKFILALIFGLLIASCQKDQTTSGVSHKKLSVSNDSTLVSSSPANFLATGGKLTLQMSDSTYVFDASKDSIAFVNIRAGADTYFGITAVNKAHTLSFAISSSGTPASGLDKGVEGSQFLQRPDVMHIKQYTLTPYAELGDSGIMQLRNYCQDSVLAKGTFFTFLALNGKANSPFVRVEGTFNLSIKP